MWIGLTCVSCKMRRLMMMVEMVIGFNIKSVRLPLRPPQTESGRAAKLEQCVDTEGIHTERFLSVWVFTLLWCIFIRNTTDSGSV